MKKASTSPSATHSPVPAPSLRPSPSPSAASPKACSPWVARCSPSGPATCTARSASSRTATAIPLRAGAPSPPPPRRRRPNGAGSITRAGYLIYQGRLGHGFAHRLAMEHVLGRALLVHEVVHHRDGNRLNNSLANLVLMSRREHNALHRRKYPLLLWCLYCGRPFHNRGSWRQHRQRFCTISCAALWRYHPTVAPAFRSPLAQAAAWGLV